MSGPQKTISMVLWVLVFVGLVALIMIERAKRNSPVVADASAPGFAVEVDDAGRPIAPGSRQLPEQFVAPAFKLTDQNGQPFDSTQLKGKVWTAMLFFSECTGVCPMMTSRITDLQNVLTDTRIHFVSLTVDPANDTPQRLAEYAQSANAQPRWHLLTGTVDEMKDVANRFKLPYDNPVDHSSKILLIDQAGSVRGIYESRETSEMKQLSVDAQRLLLESGSN
jgi:protein SCO1